MVKKLKMINKYNKNKRHMVPNTTNKLQESYICKRIGDVAQLARALAWHARGQGFESPYLHPPF